VAALNEASRQHYSQVYGFAVPAGLCRTHVKQHAKKFHGITPTYEFERARLCGKLTYQSRRTLPCRNPCMRGPNGELLGSCHVHGARGADHGYKGAAYGKLGWEKRRVRTDGAYKNQPQFKHVRVKKGERPSYAARLLNPEPKQQPRSQGSMYEEFRDEPVRPRPLKPLYPT
jgi:hypothetical protein